MTQIKTDRHKFTIFQLYFNSLNIGTKSISKQGKKNSFQIMQLKVSFQLLLCLRYLCCEQCFGYVYSSEYKVNICFRTQHWPQLLIDFIISCKSKNQYTYFRNIFFVHIRLGNIWVN